MLCYRAQLISVCLRLTRPALKEVGFFLAKEILSQRDLKQERDSKSKSLAGNEDGGWHMVRDGDSLEELRKVSS